MFQGFHKKDLQFFKIFQAWPCLCASEKIWVKKKTFREKKICVCEMKTLSSL